MAKTPARKRTPRKRAVTFKEVEKGIAVLSRQHGELQGLLAAFKQQKLDSVAMDGAGLLARGVSIVDQYLSHLEESLKQARRERDRQGLG